MPRPNIRTKRKVAAGPYDGGLGSLDLDGYQDAPAHRKRSIEA
jgi:hypothetical protein